MPRDKIYKVTQGLHKHKYILLLMCLCALALSLRLKGVFFNSFADDEPLYGWYAHQIINNPAAVLSPELNEFHPPLFSVLLALGRLFFPAGLIAFRSMALVVNLIGIILIYYLGKRLKNDFTGLLCALLLTFNYLYIFHATLITIDGTLTVALMLFLLLLSKLNEHSPVRPHLYVGLTASVICLLKCSGIIVLPLLALYYLFLPHTSLVNKAKRLAIPFLCLGATGFALTVINIIFLKTPWPYYFPKHPFLFKAEEMLFYLKNQHQIFIYIPLLPFFYYGLGYISFSRYPYKRLLLIYLLGVGFLLSLFWHKSYRFGLMLLPAMYVITAIGLDDLIQRLIKNSLARKTARIFIFLLCFLMCLHFHTKTRILIKANSTVCTGYDTAARWIMAHNTPETVIISGMARVIRYYSGINYRKFGGQLVETPGKKKEFQSLVASIQGPIILEVSRWDELQVDELPSFNNFLKEKRFFEPLGFRHAQTIFRHVFTDKTTRRTVPVIRMYIRE